ncbi:MAG: DUF2207 domain-containing protein [Acidobacteriota bacterium]
MMRYLLLLFCAWCPACLLLPGAAGAQDFTITNFVSDITVAEDSRVTVTETIDVEFHRPRHGIFRDIPYRYTNELGKTTESPLSVESVKDGTGKDWKYKVTRQGNVVDVRIGDPDKYVSGTQTYVIRYTVENMILFLDKYDEIYWNVTGDQWQATIQRASATVRLLSSKKSRLQQAACYTGVKGSTEKLCKYVAAGNIATFTADREFPPGSGFTIAYGWDKGIVSPPSELSKSIHALRLRENWLFILPLISLVTMINLWRKYGRDQKVREAVTVMYAPPQASGGPVSPAEAGALIDEKLDPRDITAAIVNLAVKGFLRIEETVRDGIIFDSKDYVLAKVKEPQGDVGPFESLLMDALFAEGTAVGASALKNKFYKNLKGLQDALYGELVEKRFFSRNPDKVRNFYRIGALVAGFAVVGLGAGFFSLLGITDSPVNLIAGVLTALPIVAFARYMPAKTRAGSSAYMDILGFREFLSRAEKDKIERMGEKDLFFKYLPYAMSLDVVDNWAKAFERIYQEPPQWYSGSGRPSAFNARSFSRSLTSATSSIATAMYSSPRGSGSGGGGSSGGGGGGGGGGSW